MPHTEEGFDKIVLREIMPLIAKAFCEMNAEMRMDSLFDDRHSNDETIKEHYNFKANQMKETISKYIDGQVRCFLNSERAREEAKGMKREFPWRFFLWAAIGSLLTKIIIKILELKGAL